MFQITVDRNYSKIAETRVTLRRGNALESIQMKSLPLVALLLAAGCSGSRRQQCDALIGKVNAASNAIANGSSAAKTDSMATLASAVDKAISELRVLPLRDRALSRRRDDYIKALASIATIARQMNDAVSRQDQTAMRDDMVRLQAAARDESTAVHDLNRDCRY